MSETYHVRDICKLLISTFEFPMTILSFWVLVATNSVILVLLGAANFTKSPKFYLWLTEWVQTCASLILFKMNLNYLLWTQQRRTKDDGKVSSIHLVCVRVFCYPEMKNVRWHHVVYYKKTIIKKLLGEAPIK